MFEATLQREMDSTDRKRRLLAIAACASAVTTTLILATEPEKIKERINQFSTNSHFISRNFRVTPPRGVK